MSLFKRALRRSPDGALGGPERGMTERRIIELSHDEAEVLEGAAREVGELSGMVERDLQIADRVADLALQAESQSMQGQDAMAGLTRNLDALRVMTDELRRALTLVEAIQSRTEVIGEIAERSKLLSLNASIEAARAGRAGAGFGVVADAMRDLADRSKQASEDILRIVGKGVEEIRRITNDTESTVERNRDVVNGSIQSFEAIATGVLDLRESIGSLVDSARAQLDMTAGVAQRLKEHTETSSRRSADTIAVVTGSKIPEMSPAEASSRLGQLVVVDVSPEDDRDSAASIAGAKAIPLTRDFERQIARLDREATYLFVCRSGGRAMRAACIARSIGFERIYNLEGGKLAWLGAGHAVDYGGGEGPANDNLEVWG